MVATVQATGTQTGEIYRVAGPVVTATGLRPRMYDVMLVGKEALLGEVIRIVRDRTTIQVYEDTSGIRPGEPVANTGQPLNVELGPGLLGSIYDGIQRPLPVLKEKMGDYVLRGVRAPGLDRQKRWPFKPLVKPGDKVQPGQALGLVQEAKFVEHRILVPPKVSGTVKDVKAGEFRVDETIAQVDAATLTLMQSWPVRTPRPVREKQLPTIPLITGQRVFDFLFPLAKGGTAAIPGGFGTGKCVVGATPVFLADGTITPIEELYRSVLGDREDSADENFVTLDRPLPVLTFDGEGIRSGRATAAYRGKTDRLTEVRLRSGRTVRLTPVHQLYRFDGHRVVETAAAELKPGDSVVVPRRLPIVSRKTRLPLPRKSRVADSRARSEVSTRLSELAKASGIPRICSQLRISKDVFWNYRLQRTAPTVSIAQQLGVTVSSVRSERTGRAISVPQVMTADLAEFLGLQLSEGTIKSRQVVEFYNNDPELRKRYAHLLLALFGLKGRERHDRTVSTITVSSRALVRVLECWAVPTRAKSRTVKVPSIVVAAAEDVIAEFLRAYAAGDGHFGDEALEIATASKAMASGLVYLFGRLGIFARASRKILEGRPYFRVWVSPKEAAPLWNAYKKESYYDSYDVVSIPEERIGLIRQALGSNAASWRQVLKNAAAGERMGRGTLRALSGAISTKTEVGNWLSRLDTMLDHVLLDRVLDVRTWDETTDVFDLTVEETHNFVGGELPMILHNTVSEHQLAKWCDAKIVVYIGCGERGNEMTEVLTEFPHLEDPQTGRPLMERTVLIANTSNMPVAAREASVYTGMAIAEYYRDMGYAVALMADSTSRWAEAMREISSRLEEMPGEEGFPAYLSARLSEFYERAGRVTTLNGQEGSISVVGAVSPSGGDFSEPVTQGTLRITKVFWALDTKLRERRHFPAVNWLTSYSLYTQSLDPWYRKNVGEDWPDLRSWASRVLQDEAELEEIVRLVGADALPEDQQLTLEVARMIREYFLQQNAFHKVDTFAPMKRQLTLIQAIRKFHDLGNKALKLDVPLRDLIALPSRALLARVKFEEKYDEEMQRAVTMMEEEFRKLEVA